MESEATALGSLKRQYANLGYLSPMETDATTVYRHLVLKSDICDELERLNATQSERIRVLEEALDSAIGWIENADIGCFGYNMLAERPYPFRDEVLHNLRKALKGEK